MTPDFDETVRRVQMADLERDNANLKSQIRQAIAWGIPDDESLGLTPENFVRLLQRALKRIEELENAR